MTMTVRAKPARIVAIVRASLSLSCLSMSCREPEPLLANEDRDA
jgi:hypothetical protein